MHGLRFAFLISLVACSTLIWSQDEVTQASSTSSSEAVQMETHSTEGQIVNGLDVGKLKKTVADIMAEAVAKGQTPGGVVGVIRQPREGEPADDNLFVMTGAYGNRAVAPTTETATLDTLYDMASLTKSVATATSIMQLVEQGKLRLTDTVDEFIPEWKNTAQEKSRKLLLESLEKALDQGKVVVNPDNLQFATEQKSLVQKLTAARKDGLNYFSPAAVKNLFDLKPRDRESITIRHLLTHTSGLPSFYRYYEKYPDRHAHDKIIKDIAQIDLRGPVGGQFIYSDLGFITLGDIVGRISGKPLNEYAKANIFEPLGMNDTSFNPPAEKRSRVAPTEWRASSTSKTAEKEMIRGEVHDGNAWVQDGVSGHAGLFSTLDDLGRFVTTLMNGGTASNGYHLLSPITVNTMTSDQARLPEGQAKRGLGWDIVSGFNGQKGDLFTTGYGHTGFTGTSIWVVTEEKLAIIILTNRVHPDGKGDSGDLRAKIANAVAGSMTESYKK